MKKGIASQLTSLKQGVSSYPVLLIWFTDLSGCKASCIVYIYTFLGQVQVTKYQGIQQRRQNERHQGINMSQESNSAVKTSAAKSGRRRILQHPRSLVYGHRCSRLKNWHIWYDPITTFDRFNLTQNATLMLFIFTHLKWHILAWSVSCWSARPLRQGRLLSKN